MDFRWWVVAAIVVVAVGLLILWAVNHYILEPRRERKQLARDQANNIRLFGHQLHLGENAVLSEGVRKTVLADYAYRVDTIRECLGAVRAARYNSPAVVDRQVHDIIFLEELLVDAELDLTQAKGLDKLQQPKPVESNANTKGNLDTKAGNGT